MKTISSITLCALGLLFMACDSAPQEKVPAVPESTEIVGLVEDVLTKEEQDALTPDMVIQSFKEGNDRFTRNDLTARNHSEQVRKSTSAQYPKAIVLSCVDSRVPVEDVFDRGIGDVFVARVAGILLTKTSWAVWSLPVKFLVLNSSWCWAMSTVER
jgi:carbonic anhydrase